MKDYTIRIINKKYVLTVKTQLIALVFVFMTMVQLMSYTDMELYREMFLWATVTNLITLAIAYCVAPIFEAQINVRDISEKEENT